MPAVAVAVGAAAASYGAVAGTAAAIGYGSAAAFIAANGLAAALIGSAASLAVDFRGSTYLSPPRASAHERFGGQQ
jgi:hypothetical protein